MTNLRVISRLGAAVVFASVAFAAAPTAQTRELTFEDRAAAQRAIEEVYWRNRIWPSENPTPKPPLAEVLSDREIRAAVADSLRKSSALAQRWNRPIQPDELQAELNRMAKDSRAPGTLQELFTALGKDPLLIAESLARRTLADRLVRESYARDERIHGEQRRRAQLARAACIDLDCLRALGDEYSVMTWRLSDEKRAPRRERETDVVELTAVEWDEQMDRLERSLGSRAETVPLGRLSAVEESEESYVVTAVLSRSRHEVTTASVGWRKPSFDAWWRVVSESYDSGDVVPTGSFTLPLLDATPCSIDTWTPTRSFPDARLGHTAVWTGTEMIVWGGWDNAGFDYQSGYRFDPTTDTWTSTSTATGAPAARHNHVAVWTGTRMIVWGGVQGDVLLNTGGRYDPATDSWSATLVNVTGPIGREHHTAIWTGSEMIVWGGSSVFGNEQTGGRYDPVADSWQLTPTDAGTGVPDKRSRHIAVWTGSRMIVWGGFTNVGRTNTGAIYDPVANIWSATTLDVSTPTPRIFHSAVWSGTEMIVWGGQGDGSVRLQTGGRYDPIGGIWTPTSIGANVPDARTSHVAVWTGSAMIVWGGSTGGSVDTGGRYSPGTDAWLPTSATGAAPPSQQATAVWTGSEMVVWGGFGTNGAIATGGRYNPVADSWVLTPSNTTEPSSRRNHTAVWTGSEMIVWGGLFGGGALLQSGGRYDPATDSWTETSLTAAPLHRAYHKAVWTGTTMIVWGGLSGGGVYESTGGRYNPTSDTWLSTAIDGSTPVGRRYHSLVWTGTRMLVWAGETSVATAVGNGGSYDPVSNAWQAIANYPISRARHTAVWTGTEMIVWGGVSTTGSAMPSGNRYAPSTNTWSTNLTGAPSARTNHTAVWTGTQMIVWGGGPSAGPPVNTGARYTPATNSWAATSTGAGVPTARGFHTAVWTGTQMIVWGGSTPAKLDTGALYDPVADTWAPTSMGANKPFARAEHTAVWGDLEMIVWGGDPTTGTGARYCGCVATLVYRDADGDGNGNAADSRWVCGPAPAGYVVNDDDCNDADGAVHPGATEVCNGVDDDCDSTIDNTGHALCDDTNACTDNFCSGASGCSYPAVDCSDDNVCTTDSCVPASGCSHTNIPAPNETGTVSVAADKVTYTWPATLDASSYDVVRGLTSALAVGPGAGDEVCFPSLAGPMLVDATLPASGTAFWYLTRGVNACGVGSYGEQSNGTPRTTTTCP